ncbi:MAG: phage tail assembly protein [Rhizobiales bacterium]|nr:phage tail assembly protein [Hyphomicrobiales bacterium]
MTSNRPQTALVSTPQSKNNPADVKVEEIPLPPSEMWEELDNSGKAKGKEQAETPAAKPVEIAAEPIEELEFVGESHRKLVPLSHPFRRNGAVVDQITVKRLRIGDVDRFIKRAQGGSFSTFDIYAEMTGLPAAVLRGLVDEDGDAVTDACYDFLPRSLRPEPASSES